jgi:hypothetical protein
MHASLLRARFLNEVKEMARCRQIRDEKYIFSSKRAAGRQAYKYLAWEQLGVG